MIIFIEGRGNRRMKEKRTLFYWATCSLSLLLFIPSTVIHIKAKEVTRTIENPLSVTTPTDSAVDQSKKMAPATTSFKRSEMSSLDKSRRMVSEEQPKEETDEQNETGISSEQEVSPVESVENEQSNPDSKELATTAENELTEGKNQEVTDTAAIEQQEK